MLCLKLITTYRLRSDTGCTQNEATKMAVKGKGGFLKPRGKSKFIQPVVIGSLVFIDKGVNAGKTMRVATVLENGTIEVDDKEFGQPVYYAADEFWLIKPL